ncbi:MAG: hypothetical protein EON93_04540 [Burkholderiales bacterium]|nr:MAG: hypothetical protein EON93_04540 [Burkholderiales bacterium]
MSSSFTVVTDVAEIALLNRELGRRLSKTFKVRRTRQITYPAGHETGTVYFESGGGTSVRAWSPSPGPDKLVNFLLVGDPSTEAWMEIDVQLNFPAGSYNRRMAGAFVIDDKGDVLVAHRGKLTKGRAGLKKAKVFREFAAHTVEAEDQGRTSKVILISALDDTELADRLWEFAVEAREVATRIAAETGGEEAEVDAPTSSRTDRPQGGKLPTRPKDAMLKLRDYFDEYAGEGTSKGHGGGKRTVEHGDVVKALEALLRADGRSQKAQAIDLAIVAAEVDLYEVKTSARTTDVYTGVGQLLIHGECIRELLELPVRRHLVLPEPPRASHGKHVTKKGGINIVTYEMAGAGYKFSGLV